jgi:hypothetical protein
MMADEPARGRISARIPEAVRAVAPTGAMVTIGLIPMPGEHEPRIFSPPERRPSRFRVGDGP